MGSPFNGSSTNIATIEIAADVDATLVLSTWHKSGNLVVLSGTLDTNGIRLRGLILALRSQAM
jgi:hypothetical protein